ncbi:alpha-N-arabinofuranosidase [Compostimonas suwonensis]|uniref:non-reducing end alpha-L-arabinofuranosidase n=1 Tax=Compostimonas suwonensis TaxID=1048394 RepID=A0A2M9C3M8_9MICO|nr:alpha-N-arabinofuranosidase [Compostimonas suwonensis]
MHHLRPTADPAASDHVGITLGPAVGTASPRLFGSFVEHLGRGVYGGIYEPGHPSATSEGFRGDVLELVRELGVTVVRYPGGNFVSGYDWRDGVGPRDRRPSRLDLAWKSIETNEFGTDEFAAWCRAAGVEPMLAINLGLGDTASAVRLLEYTNHPSGTELSDERVANGSPEPHDVRLWCLGNELDGPWQLGHRTAEGYAEIAAVTASAMRMFDPELELVAVGSSNAEMPTFGAWEQTVLERTAGLVDFLSCHIYFYEDDDLGAFLRSARVLDGFLEKVDAVIRHVKATQPDARDVKISLDEWNVWDHREYGGIASRPGFEIAPRLLEVDYTVADAVVVGSLLQSILTHCDIVTIAAMAQLVNVIGPIRAEPGTPAWRQTIFHPFAAAARSAGHTVISTRTDAADTADGADTVATVTQSADGTAVEVMLTNRSPERSADVDLDLRSLAPDAVESAQLLWDPDAHASNTADDRDRVVLRPVPAVLGEGRLRLSLPPVSWAAVRLSCRPNGG